MDSDKIYFYSDGKEQFGPLSLEELLERDIRRETLIWHRGLDKWKPASEIPELREHLKWIPPSLEQEPVEQVSEEAGQKPSEPARPTGREDSTDQKPPKTWMVESILVSLFCCFPLGLAGLVHAAKVEAYFSSGNTSAAERASREAGRWTKTGFWIGFALVLLYFLLLMEGYDVQFNYDTNTF